MQCDVYVAPALRALAFLTLIGALLLSGALATRVGPGLNAMRGALASGLGVFVLMLGVRISEQPGDGRPVAVGVAVLVTSIAAGMGYVGGLLIRRRARSV
jgi:hypothetical protein